MPEVAAKNMPRKSAAASRSTEALEIKTLVKPVINALAILRYLGQQSGSHTATNIAKAIGINTSTCFNILRTLLHEGVVDFDRVGKTYTIGYGLAKLVRLTPANDHIQTIRPHIHDLADEFDLTIALWQRVGPDRMISVLVEPTVADFRIHIRTGQRLPALLGSAGRAMAPHLGLTKPEIRQKFAQLRWAQPITFEQYWKEVKLGEERGYAIDDGHFATGIITISAPVIDPAGQAQYCLTGLTFRGRLDENGQHQFGEAIAALGQKLTAILY